MEFYTIWIIIGILFFIVEIFTPGFFLASIGAGAFLSALSAYLGGGLTVQFIALAAGTLLFFIGFRPFLLSKLKRKGGDYKTGTDALIGKDAQVVEPIHNLENIGRIKVGGELWKARSDTENQISAGVTVTVQSVDGVTLTVQIKKES